MSENQKDPQYKLRWSEELRGKITDAAKENNRSINAEITQRLEDSFTNKSVDPDFFQKNMNFFLAAYCAGLESNYDEAIAQLEEALSKSSTIDEQTKQYLEHRLQVNKILKKEMNRLVRMNSERIKDPQIVDSDKLL